ncbi:hypothetical protein P171DRAFT_481245 [Karstenula rhodostoma CBS 690.94]|uniref:Uncharacterized protein n=1 Tax=Karstenula rhodostoma CBS 690.94 TaxID=1392251 RepID=A0A9P4PSI1_9PLEO|nr:hypothetical protein P171DRAFT_481245 [Karstenula rhodostoma CBS 690.94]
MSAFANAPKQQQYLLPKGPARDGPKYRPLQLTHARDLTSSVRFLRSMRSCRDQLAVFVRTNMITSLLSARAVPLWFPAFTPLGEEMVQCVSIKSQAAMKDVLNGGHWASLSATVALKRRETETMFAYLATTWHRNHFDSNAGLVACVNSTQAPTPLPQAAGVHGCINKCVLGPLNPA